MRNQGEWKDTLQYVCQPPAAAMRLKELNEERQDQTEAAKA